MSTATNKRKQPNADSDENNCVSLGDTARATKRKKRVSFKAIGKPAEVLLGQLMGHHLYAIDSGIGHVDDNDPLASSGTTTGLSFDNILHNINMRKLNTRWRNAWKSLSEQNWIRQIESSGGFYTSAFSLTPTGLEEASTEEVKEIMAKNSVVSKKPKTDDELHEHIKGRLMNQRGEEIFDLLVGHGPMSRKKLAEHIGISDRGAYFSYALQQLKDLGYAENMIAKSGTRKTKVTLTGKSFVNGKVQTLGKGNQEIASRSSSSTIKTESLKTVGTEDLEGSVTDVVKEESELGHEKKLDPSNKRKRDTCSNTMIQKKIKVEHFVQKE